MICLSIQHFSEYQMLSSLKLHIHIISFLMLTLIIISDIARKLSGARSYSNAQMIARAIITQSMTSSLESSHYIKNGSLAADTRMFGDKQKAVDWLNEKVKEFVKPN